MFQNKLHGFSLHQFHPKYLLLQFSRMKQQCCWASVPSHTSKTRRKNLKANLLYWKETKWFVGAYLWFPEGCLSLANLSGPQFLKERRSLEGKQTWGAKISVPGSSRNHLKLLAIAQVTRWTPLSAKVFLEGKMTILVIVWHKHYCSFASYILPAPLYGHIWCSLSVGLTGKYCTSSFYLDIIMENA